MSLLPMVHADDSIKASVSDVRPRIDGKFTSDTEWSDATITNVQSNGYNFVIQAKQDRNFVYLILDGVDFQTDPQTKDISVRYQVSLCFDTHNDKGDLRQPADFCHTSTVNNEFGKQVKTENAPQQFDSNGRASHLDITAPFRDMWGFGRQNDPFEKDSDHLVYEIRIPKKMIKFEDAGFSFSMYADSAHDDLVQLVNGVVWPQNSDMEKPSTWGTLLLPQMECEQNMVLVLKSSDDSQVCVKSSSKEKLIERGWAKILSGSSEDVSVTPTEENPFMADKNGKVDLSKIHLSPTKYGQIDFGKIGYLVSENEFKKILEQRNITYSHEDLTFITGLSLDSYPPSTDYCGYVISNNKQDYWFWSSFYNDTLTSAKLYNENPDPCTPSHDSCTCSLQLQLAEKNTELSYLSDSEEQTIGKIIQGYLSETPVSNVPDRFVVGNYNFGSTVDTTPYCGKFVDENRDVYFMGYIQRSKVVDFELAFEQPKLCVITDTTKIFDFKKPPLPQ